MITFVLLYMIYCIVHGYHDARYPAIFHFRATLLRIATSIVITYLYCGVMAPFWLYVNVAFIQAFTFWLVFDIARNLADGQRWNYIGATASIDKWLGKFRSWQAWAMKFALWVLSIAAYIIFWSDPFIIHSTLLIDIYHGIPGRR